MAKNLRLYCDNPQCSKEIKEEQLMYNSKDQEIYHIGDCPLLAGALKAFKKGTFGVLQVESISKDKALELLETDKLMQTGLERKVKE